MGNVSFSGNWRVVLKRSSQPSLESQC